MPASKVCISCSKRKPTTEFSAQYNTKDKLRAHCKECFGAKLRKGKRKTKRAKPDKKIARANQKLQSNGDTRMALSKTVRSGILDASIAHVVRLMVTGKMTKLSISLPEDSITISYADTGEE